MRKLTSYTDNENKSKRVNLRKVANLHNDVLLKEHLEQSRCFFRAKSAAIRVYGNLHFKTVKGVPMLRYFGKNIRPFSAVCGNSYGRKPIITNASRITEDNIELELSRALVVHQQNAIEIEYLDNYYRGDQPILYRKKDVRPEINNKIVENLAYMIVETKTADMVGEPIQYVLRGDDETKSEQITRLNTIMEGEDKAYYDIELCRWRSICGTAYRFIGRDTSGTRLLDEANFTLSTEDPTKTFVCYYANGKPAFSCQIRQDENNETIYNIFTVSQFFVVKANKVIESSINGNFAIPVIEYPNNARRISDIEITISITDEINKMASDRSNGIEQFVSSWVKFVNCEIDSETFKQMRMEGALVVKSNNGTDNKADVDIMTSELNQSQSQVVVSDQYEKLLVIQGLASRQDNTGGDTQGAVQLRNGHYDAEKRAELSEPIFKRAERDMLRIVLNSMRIYGEGFILMPSDVEIHISRSKVDNMQVKAEVLKMLLDSGINPERAIKTVGLFSDPEQVAIESRDRMKILYPTDVEPEESDPNGPNAEN